MVTLKQPEATAVVSGRKKRLIRGRRIAYRGPLLIHAASEEPSGKELAAYPEVDAAALPCGAILGVVQVVGCVPTGEGYGYEWFLADPRPLTRLYPCKGRWGLWNSPPDLVVV